MGVRYSLHHTSRADDILQRLRVPAPVLRTEGYSFKAMTSGTHSAAEDSEGDGLTDGLELTSGEGGVTLRAKGEDE